MLDDILSKDLAQAIRNTEKTQNIIKRIYYTENLSIFFRKTSISLIDTALSFILNNLKILQIQYQAQLNLKDKE